jgi:hypothetical protein
MKLTGLPYEEIDPNDAKITAKRKENKYCKDLFI